jgi:hypothetical protein
VRLIFSPKNTFRRSSEVPRLKRWGFMIDIIFIRPLNNAFFRHSGLDPESRKSLKPLDPPVKPGDDDIITLITFCKDLFIMPFYNEKPYY